MSRRFVTGAAVVAGVVGRPIAHSLSPVIHGAWIAAAGLDAAYVPFAPDDEAGFDRLVRACRGGLIKGVNVTAPFKERALALADEACATARRAGSANLLLFEPDGTVLARSTDGAGVIGAFAEQAPGFDPAAGPAVVLGAGGAARAAAAALLDAGCPLVKVVNRTRARAEELVFAFSGEPVEAFALNEAERALDGACALIAAAAGGPSPPVRTLAPGAAVLDMTYRPVRTALLAAAEAAGLTPVDGLSMLINQAAPSFEAFFGAPPPDVDVRSLALEAAGR